MNDSTLTTQQDFDAEIQKLSESVDMLAKNVDELVSENEKLTKEIEGLEKGLDALDTDFEKVSSEMVGELEIATQNFESEMEKLDKEE
jgi:peptidoglycan hydrolase CwlO-like protein